MFHDFSITALTDLEKLPETFYLTGSKYFGSTDGNSDTDFFVTYTDKLYSKLMDLGFASHAGHDYKDLSCITVVRKGRVDVQLVRDAILKNQVQDYLKNRRGLTRPTTDQWNETMEIAQFFSRR